MSSSSSGNGDHILKQAKDAARLLARLRPSSNPSSNTITQINGRYLSNDERAIEITKQRRIVRELFSTLIKDHHAHAEANEAEADLWRHAFYTDIDLLRKRIAKLRTDRDATIELAATEKELRDFIDDAKQFYQQLFSIHLAQARITSTSTSFRDQLVVSSRRRRGNGRSDSGSSALVAALAAVDANATAAMLRSLHTCYRSLIFLGDLERYYQASMGAMARPERAEAQYRLALQLIPENGHAHNQLAVMSSSANQTLSTAWRYIRAMAVRGLPFTQAVTNLEAVFDSNDKKTRTAFQPLSTITARGPSLTSQQAEQLVVFIYGLLYHQHPDVTSISMITDAIYYHLPKWLAEHTVFDCLNWLMALIYFFQTTLQPVTDRRTAAAARIPVTAPPAPGTKPVVQPTPPVAPTSAPSPTASAASSSSSSPASSSSSSAATTPSGTSPATTSSSSSSPSAGTSLTSSSSSSTPNPWLVPPNYTTVRNALPETTQRAHISVSIWTAQLMSRVMKHDNMARSLPIVGCFFDWLRINPQLLSMTREMTETERYVWQVLWQETATLLTRLQAMIHLHDPTLSNPQGTGGAEWPIAGMPLLDEEVELRGFAYMMDAYPTSASRFDFAERRSGRISMVEAAARPTRARGDRKERPQADDALRRHKLLQFGLQQGASYDLLKFDAPSGQWWCTWQPVPAAVAEARANGILYVNPHHHSPAMPVSISASSSPLVSPRGSSGPSSLNSSPFTSPGGSLSRRTISGGNNMMGAANAPGVMGRHSPAMGRSISSGNNSRVGSMNSDHYGTGSLGGSPPGTTRSNRNSRPTSAPGSHPHSMDTDGDGGNVRMLRGSARDLAMIYQQQQQGHHPQQSPHHGDSRGDGGRHQHHSGHTSREDATLTLLASAANQGSGLSSNPPSWLANVPYNERNSAASPPPVVMGLAHSGHNNSSGGSAHPGHMSAHNAHHNYTTGRGDRHGDRDRGGDRSNDHHRSGGRDDHRDHGRDNRNNGARHSSAPSYQHHHGGHGQHSHLDMASSSSFDYDMKRSPPSGAWTSHHSGGSNNHPSGGGMSSSHIDQQAMDMHEDMEMMANEHRRGRQPYDNMASAVAAEIRRGNSNSVGPQIPSQALMSVQAAVAASNAEQAPLTGPSHHRGGVGAPPLSAIPPSALSAMFASPVPLDSPLVQVIAGLAPTATELAAAAAAMPPQDEPAPNADERQRVRSLENQFDSLLDDDRASSLPMSASSSSVAASLMPPRSHGASPVASNATMMNVPPRRGHSPSSHLQHVPLRPSSTSPPLPLSSPLMRNLHSGSPTPIAAVPPHHSTSQRRGGPSSYDNGSNNGGNMNMITEDDGGMRGNSHSAMLGNNNSGGNNRRSESPLAPLEGWTPFGRTALPSTGVNVNVTSVATPAPRAANASWTTTNLFSAAPRADIIDRGTSPSPSTTAEAHRMAGRMSDMYSRNFFASTDQGQTSSGASLAVGAPSRSGSSPPQRISPPQSLQNALSPRNSSSHVAMLMEQNNREHHHSSNSGYNSASHSRNGSTGDDEFHRSSITTDSRSPIMNTRTPPPQPSPSSAGGSLNPSAAPWSMQYNTASFGNYTAPSPRHSAAPVAATYTPRESKYTNNNNNNNSNTYGMPSPPGANYGSGTSVIGGAPSSSLAPSHYNNNNNGGSRGGYNNSNSGGNNNNVRYEEYLHVNNGGNSSSGNSSHYSGMIVAPKASTSPPVMLRTGVYHAPSSGGGSYQQRAPAKHNGGSGHI